MAMVYTVKQLADLAGVSVRTLHYYDEIGLLPPARGSANGYRYYGEADILRLQQILFYKELGLGLDEIGALLQEPGFDVVRALEEHRGALAQRLGRLRRLMQTVERTIAQLKGVTPMDAKALFAGFSEAEQEKYAAEAEALWGESVRESSRKWKAYTPAKKTQVMAEGKVVYEDLIDLLDQPPGSAVVQAVIARWHQHLRYFFEPAVEVLRGLAKGYNDDPPFRATFDKMEPRLAPFMLSAITVYCDKLDTKG
jgi:DNA-binding transcriptional MerR regulator